MASHTPGGQLQKSRHRITNIKLEPSTSNYDISLKILVDEQEPLRLATIQRGLPLSWEMALSCDVDPSSLVEIRVYEKHFMSNKRVGTLGYTVSTAADKSEIQIDFDTRRFTATLSFPTPEAVHQAAGAALTKAQAREKKKRILERLGSTREALKAILDFGQAVSELHPAAKVAFGVCTLAWNALEKQEQCDASVEKLVVDLAGMLPMVDRVKKAATLPQLQDTVKTLMNLIEDASRFVIEYRTEGGPEPARRCRLQGSGPSAGSARQVPEPQGRIRSRCRRSDSRDDRHSSRSAAH
ncbi:hypothetical protein BDV93DRAFT_340546 [Ceratobasidium sp. AG-I]|nr:hypothetical protein BDV93DRAFT_340546 [Ceratobasidium sp. AG-I]